MELSCREGVTALFHTPFAFRLLACATIFSLQAQSQIFFLLVSFSELAFWQRNVEKIFKECGGFLKWGKSEGMGEGKLTARNVRGRF